MLTQEVDAIVHDENLSDANSAFEPSDPQTPETPPAEPVTPPEEPPTDLATPPVEPPADPDAPVTPPEEPPVEPPAAPESTERSPTETVAEARSIIDNLQLTDDKIFNEDGTVKPWTEVVPAGAYFASQLSPVTVTDKDGKTHEFMLLSDVEKAFPDGFEAKNNIEQMKFEKGILGNEAKFDKAVETYKDAEARYAQETGDMVQKNADRERIGAEYKAMADQGLVPKVGDPNDPKFNESDAVKELIKINTWMQKTNADNAAKGLGQITSLYVAKQLMDGENKVVDNTDRKNEVISERNEVASLSSSPTPNTGSKQSPYANVPLGRMADAIIQEENLR